ncbi:Rrf2 family transcriptional regulator [Roseomonas sp. NAR14]|uniref:Rrf2 family transcriptional regulator n=1 Tax=Roseomonas acroporae TaxID=2937791 RepID=A0A9X1Y3V0_9PROT|nr:Rrf2 family transcriptional regulator [Roseomonas acroporae]MCK8783694.1 Rrf2 family transcriptional regulator [Roseomonas acroporae]
MLLRRDRAMTAVAIMLDVAFHAGRGTTVSAADIADRLGQARRGIEPVLQALSRAGLLDSLRGPRGGYRLGRPKRSLTVAEIIAAAVDTDGDADVPTGQLQAAVVVPLWNDLEAMCREHLSKLTVDDLVKRAVAAGMRRPTSEPLTFAI